MRVPYEYAVVQAVPRIERGERINVGVILYCRPRDFLAVATHLDPARLLALDPGADVAAVGAALEGWRRTCDGAGPARDMKPGERFRWLTAPRSTILQSGPVHTGLTSDPVAELERLATLLVR
jgi:Protein of unknown function (DUF3037)